MTVNQQKGLHAIQSHAFHSQAATQSREYSRRLRLRRERAHRAQLERAARAYAPAASPPAPAPQAPPAVSSVQSYALSLVGAAQFACLKPLWDEESGWNPSATNPSSGAYGIPQALPGSKMASAGADWQTNPYTQVRWGIQYLHDSYGSACAGWAHEQANGWY